jgi:histidine ammonia-lyase
MRSTPQVIGAARDQLRWTREQLEIEANGVGDNPIFLADDKAVLTGANFQGTPVSLPIDTLGAAVAMVCVLSERRLNRLTNPALSVGLPDFLTKGAGMFSGMMLSSTPPTPRSSSRRSCPRRPSSSRSPPPPTRRTSCRWE